MDRLAEGQGDIAVDRHASGAVCGVKQADRRRGGVAERFEVVGADARIAVAGQVFDGSGGEGQKILGVGRQRAGGVNSQRAAGNAQPAAAGGVEALHHRARGRAAAQLNGAGSALDRLAEGQGDIAVHRHAGGAIAGVETGDGGRCRVCGGAQANAT